MRQGGGADGKVVAVIGDGALTGGVAFEALHNAGGLRHADRDRAERQRHVDRAERRRALALLQPRAAEPEAVPGARGRRGDAHQAAAGIGERFERLGPQLKESIKAYWAPGLFFEELDLAYVGVIDGHDVRRCARRSARRSRRTARSSCTCHRQGQGLRARRGGRARGHGEVARRQARLDRRPARRRRRRSRRREPTRGRPPRRSTRPCSARRSSRRPPRPRVVGITAAMNSGTGLNILQKALPERYYDVGIAEQHAVLFAAGLALEGAKPVCRDLLDLPAARLRPDRPRRLPAEAERRVRDGPRRPRRRRRADAPRRVRHLLPALPAEHGPDGAARRGDARAHAAHRARSTTTGRSRCATRAARPRACRCPSAPRADRDRPRRDPARGRAGRAARLRLRRARGARAPPTSSPSTGSEVTSPTRASPSRSTPS
jgi:hypothetical protein